MRRFVKWAVTLRNPRAADARSVGAPSELGVSYRVKVPFDELRTGLLGKD